MKKTVIILILLNLTIHGFTQDLIIAAGDNQWFTTYSSALADAQKNDNMILVNFTGSDWCIWCFRLTDNVFSKSEFKEWQKDNATLLYLDFPQKKEISEDQLNHNRMLAQLYGIQGFPTILILNKNGHVIGKTGYGDDVLQWISDVEKSKEDYKRIIEEF